MIKIRLIAVFALTVLATVAARGQTQLVQTSVSSFGADTNPCTRTAPCKTFAGALAQTLPGGEIDVLDTGNFGPVTITKSVTIDGGSDQIASVVVSSGNAIVVQAGATDVVFLRNLRLDGLLGNGSNSSNAGTNGILWSSGKALHIENCEIFGFNNNGINIAKSDGGQLFITNTVVKNNALSGVIATNTAKTMSARIVNSQFEGNGFVGVFARDFSTFSVSNSDASGNAWGYVAQTTGAGLTATMNILNSQAANNSSFGIQVGGNGGNDRINIEGVGLFNNVHGIIQGSPGIVKSWGNNYNTDDGAPTPPNLTSQ